MCRITSLVVKFYSFVDGCVRVSRMAFCLYSAACTNGKNVCQWQKAVDILCDICKLGASAVLVEV